MSQLTARISWAGGMSFTGESGWGNKIIMDADPKVGGQQQGPKPTEMLLFALAGCTGMDVVSILRKQRQEFRSLTIDVTGEQPDQFPKPFHTIQITFTLSGVNLDPDKVAEAIHLSESKYCSISQTLKEQSSITTRFEILPE